MLKEEKQLRLRKILTEINYLGRLLKRESTAAKAVSIE
jgi:hypothetical protein